jgi:hypothetical protein
MFNEQTEDTGHLIGLRNKFSSITIILIKKKDQIKLVKNIIFLNSDEAHIMKWCTSMTYFAYKEYPVEDYTGTKTLPVRTKITA